MPRTLIFAGSRESARKWCVDNGVRPYAKTTFLFSTAIAAIGTRITADDCVVVLDPDEDLSRTLEYVKRKSGIS